jgi:hypothetical protein
MADPNAITLFLPILSAKKPPAKFAVIIATLLADTKSPNIVAVDSSVLANSLTKKNTGEADTIELAKIAVKIMTIKTTKFREA